MLGPRGALSVLLARARPIANYRTKKPTHFLEKGFRNFYARTSVSKLITKKLWTHYHSALERWKLRGKTQIQPNLAFFIDFFTEIDHVNPGRK